MGGALELSLIDGFSPSPGQTFDILDWGSVAGAFSAIILPALDGFAWDASQLAAGILSVAPAYQGDFDEDGDVDGDDLTNWRTGFGKSIAALHTDGDADGDADVDGADFLAWQRQLGSANAVPRTGAVPEPNAVWLALCACLVTSWTRLASLARRQSLSLRAA